VLRVPEGSAPAVATPSKQMATNAKERKGCFSPDVEVFIAVLPSEFSRTAHTLCAKRRRWVKLRPRMRKLW
jgi:hypothetical protein